MSATRNTKIIDADIQFYLDETPLNEIEKGKYFKYESIHFNQLSPPINQIYNVSTQWVLEQKLNLSAFGGYLLEVDSHFNSELFVIDQSFTVPSSDPVNN